MPDDDLDLPKFLRRSTTQEQTMPIEQPEDEEKERTMTQKYRRIETIDRLLMKLQAEREVLAVELRSSLESSK